VGTFSRSRRMGRPRRQTVCFYLTARCGFAVPLVDLGIGHKVKVPTLAAQNAARMGHPQLFLYEFSEHLFGVDGDEGAATAGQDFVLFVQDLGHVDVLTTVDADFPALDA
jgi:hypothetical protein